ncbi:MAG: coproporphyrinogen-III oxidase family protein [Acidobacteriota bacterium]
MSAAAGTPDERPGLYVHVPFCSAICPYCDFAVRVGGEPARRRYAEALRLEIDRLIGTSSPAADEALDNLRTEIRAPLRRLIAPRTRGPETAAARSSTPDDARFSTLYLGGGTPSILDVDTLAGLVEHLRIRLPLADDLEIFLEANPEDLAGADGARRLDAWRALGVGFLSLGVQSLDDDELRFLGRRHTGAEARAAVERALEADFATVSVDLIYGLPDQPATETDWSRRLDDALALGSHHLSLYELEIHERTVFGKLARRGELIPAPEPRRAALFRHTHRRLLDAGWDVYEVSNFARTPAHRSRHNQKYWRHIPYLGLGPSAHSYAATDGVAVRWWNERSTPRWQRLLESDASPIQDAEVLTPADLVLETLMLGLRTPAGVDLSRLRVRTGVDLLRVAAPALEQATSDGLARLDGDHLLPTLDGMAVADALAAELTEAEGI